MVATGAWNQHLLDKRALVLNLPASLSEVLHRCRVGNWPELPLDWRADDSWPNPAVASNLRPAAAFFGDSEKLGTKAFFSRRWHWNMSDCCVLHPIRSASLSTQYPSIGAAHRSNVATTSAKKEADKLALFVSPVRRKCSQSSNVHCHGSRHIVPPDTVIATIGRINAGAKGGWKQGS